jgi:hypothetical protein
MRARRGADGRLDDNLREGDAASERAGAQPFDPQYRGPAGPPEE